MSFLPSIADDVSRLTGLVVGSKNQVLADLKPLKSWNKFTAESFESPSGDLSYDNYNEPAISIFKDGSAVIESGYRVCYTSLVSQDPIETGASWTISMDVPEFVNNGGVDDNYNYTGMMQIRFYTPGQRDEVTQGFHMVYDYGWLAAYSDPWDPSQPGPYTDLDVFAASPGMYVLVGKSLGNDGDGHYMRLSIYRNGVHLISDEGYVNTPLNSNTEVEVSIWNEGNANMRVKDVSFFDRALTHQEALRLSKSNPMYPVGVNQSVADPTTEDSRSLASRGGIVAKRLTRGLPFKKTVAGNNSGASASAPAEVSGTSNVTSNVTSKRDLLAKMHLERLEKRDELKKQQVQKREELKAKMLAKRQSRPAVATAPAEAPAAADAPVPAEAPAAAKAIKATKPGAPAKPVTPAAPVAPIAPSEAAAPVAATTIAPTA